MAWRRRRILQATGSGIIVLALGRSFAASAAEPYRVGALNPITGAGSPYGSGIQKSIIFSADEGNAAIGAACRKLEIYAQDSQTSPEAPALAPKKLIKGNKVQSNLRTHSAGVTPTVLSLLA